MKEYVANTGGRKLFNEDVLSLQDLAKSYEAFYEGKEPFIISGVELTNTGGNLYDVSSGYIWLDGRIRYVAAASGVNLGSPKYINISDVSENSIYNDLISRESAINYGTVISSSFISADQSLSLSSSSKRYVKDILGADLLVKNPNTVNQTVNKELILTGQLTAQNLIKSNNGIEVTSGGINVSAGGLDVSGGFTVSSGVANLSASALVQGGLTVSSGGLNVTGSGVFNNGLTVSGLANFNGGMNVNSISTPLLTVTKSGNTSTIRFPSTVNDSGFIDHTEVSNSATMRFSAGDDTSVNDKFEFGEGTQSNWNPKLTIYSTGRLDVNGVQVIDSDARISWSRLKNNVSISAGSGLTGGGSLTTNRSLSIANGGVVNTMIANSTITGSKIGIRTITGNNLATRTVGTSEIAYDAVTLSRMQNMSPGRFMGRRSNVGTGSPEHLTAAQLADELGVAIRVVASTRLTFVDYDYSSFSLNNGGVITSISQLMTTEGKRGSVQVNHNLGHTNYFVLASAEGFFASGTNSEEALRAIYEDFRYAVWDRNSNNFKIVINENSAENQQIHYMWLMIVSFD